MPLAVLASSNFTDPEHERVIWLAVGGLLLLGVVLLVVTVVWWRGTKGEHAALAPLEVMGERSFAGLTHVEQSRRLDAVRLQLDGDVEPHPMVAEDAVDLDEVLRSFQPGFDDLRDERAPAAAPSAAADAQRISVEVVSASTTTGAESTSAEPAIDEAVEPVTADGGVESPAPLGESGGAADNDTVAAAGVSDGDAAGEPARAVPAPIDTSADHGGVDDDGADAIPVDAEPDVSAVSVAEMPEAVAESPHATGEDEAEADSGVAPATEPAGDRHRNGDSPGDRVARDADDVSSGNGTNVHSIDPLLAGEPVER